MPIFSLLQMQTEGLAASVYATLTALFALLWASSVIGFPVGIAVQKNGQFDLYCLDGTLY